MGENPDFDINELGDPLKGEEPNLEKNHFDNRKNDAPEFLNRPERTLLIGASAVVIVISILVFLSPGREYPSKADLEALTKRMDRIEGLLASREGKTKYHVVARGESLPAIAKKYSLAVDQIRDLNNMKPRQSVQPGQKLLVSTVKGS